MSGMGAVLQLMAQEGAPLRKIISGLPLYVMVKQKAQFPMDRVPRLLEVLEKKFPGAQRSTLDGLKLSWEGSWLHVRASNTEPIIRVVAEAKTRSRAQSLVREAQKIIASLK
jgi:phosphomannomutase